MPGLAGIITQMPRTWAEPQLMRMLKSLQHESFYNSGTWIDETLGVYVGWTALPNSFSDGMPVTNRRRDVWLTFSGEEYLNVKSPVGTKGEGKVQNKGQAHYLAQLYEDDPSFPTGLNGIFHALLVDQSRRNVLLFNDRYGMHPLFYHQSKEGLYFAGEAKAIAEALPNLRIPCAESLGEFAACSCVLENRTIFKDIYTMPPGSVWRFHNEPPTEEKTYFTPSEWEGLPPLSSQSYHEELQTCLSDRLPLYFSGRERAAIALTGGLDTRVIMSLYRAPAGSMPCYTFGGMYRDCQDVQIARKIANLCQQSHTTITVGSEFLQQFAHYAERTVYLTEGRVDVYRSADLYVSRKAREIAPAKVVGTYGSEIVRHAVMFKPMAPEDALFQPEFVTQVRAAEKTYKAIRNIHPVTFAAFRQSPWYHNGVLSLEQSQLTVRSPFLDNKFVELAYRNPSLNNGFDVRLELIRNADRRLAVVPSDRGVTASTGTLSTTLLRGFREFTFKAEYAYDYGMPNWAARADHLLAPLHPERIFLGRHKFLHYRIWYRDLLADYLKQILLDPLTLSRPYLNGRHVEKVINSHIQGERNNTITIHKLLTLELIHRLFFD